MFVNINQGEWNEPVYLDINQGTLYRVMDPKETAYYHRVNNTLLVFWDYWDPEVFITQDGYNFKLATVDQNDSIPNILHFVYGMEPQTEEFELYKYIAVMSAWTVNRPEKVYFYYRYEPFGKWWEKIKPILTMEMVEPISSIFGNPVCHRAHQADILRLQKLIERGGIYLDIDTISVSTMRPFLGSNHHFIIEKQDSYNPDQDGQVYGICNAVMLSRPYARFPMKWLSQYRTFRSKGDDENWDEHSVRLPKQLIKMEPDSTNITLLSGKSFLYPLWEDMRRVLFKPEVSVEEYRKIAGESYCIHLWDSSMHSILVSMTEDFIMETDTLYNVLARKFLRSNMSLVFLTHNRYEKTKTCLESYLECLQREDVREMLILDNGSEEEELINFLAVLEAENPKVRVIYSEVNLGVCPGRMRLFEEAQGDIVASIDSDALLLSIEFLDTVKGHLNDERYGIIGIAGAHMTSWDFGTHQDIPEEDEKDYVVPLLAGCCQCFRRDLRLFGFKMDPNYGKFWVEDSDLCMQVLNLNKKNLRIGHKRLIHHQWGGSGQKFVGLFEANWAYFRNKWEGKIRVNGVPGGKN
jgi:GT2 family glycosyltransferase